MKRLPPTFLLALCGAMLTSCGRGSRQQGISITDPTAPASVVISPSNPTVTLGSTLQLSESARDSNGVALTGNATWLSSEPAVADVAEQTGLVTARSVGSTLITATVGTLSGTTTLTVSAGSPNTGAVSVSTVTSGAHLPAAYTIVLDNGGTQVAGPNATVFFTSVTVGAHTVAITNVPANCTVSGSSSTTVTVTANQSALASFAVSCV